jgi:hypothetical protein
MVVLCLGCCDTSGPLHHGDHLGLLVGTFLAGLRPTFGWAASGASLLLFSESIVLIGFLLAAFAVVTFIPSRLRRFFKGRQNQACGICVISEPGQARWIRLARNYLLLENQPQRELDLPGCAVGTASGTDRGRDRASQGLGNLAEIRITFVVNGIGEIGVIEEIEEVRSELQARSLAPYPEGLRRREVPVEQSRANHACPQGGLQDQPRTLMKTTNNVAIDESLGF